MVSSSYLSLIRSTAALNSQNWLGDAKDLHTANSNITLAMIEKNLDSTRHATPGEQGSRVETKVGRRTWHDATWSSCSLESSSKATAG